MANSQTEPKPNTDTSNTKGEKNFKKWFIENVSSLGLALLLVFAFRSTILEPFKIPSGSMIPTLLVGDYIFVNKFAYGFKVPFTDMIGDAPKILIQRDGPKRGDVIVFRYPLDESQHYIKRVIGLPGDRIELKQKVVYINDVAAKRDSVSEEERIALLNGVEDAKYNFDKLAVSRESVDEHKFTMMVDQGGYHKENYGPITVPDGHYFVMGDNRDYSSDSRYWGFVPYKNIKGQAVVIWLSLWLGFGEGEEFHFRPLRTGKVIP